MLQTGSAYLGYGFSCQSWKADTAAGAKPILKEEVFHMVQQYLWAAAYPNVFGMSWSTTHCKSLQAAQCTWWMHPENVGCRDSSGSACSNTEATVSCTGACASFNTAGQCYDNPETCAGPSCDCIEYFHKMCAKAVYDHSDAPG